MCLFRKQHRLLLPMGDNAGFIPFLHPQAMFMLKCGVAVVAEAEPVVANGHMVNLVQECM
jgi:hypothetical protein